MGDDRCMHGPCSAAAIVAVAIGEWPMAAAKVLLQRPTSAIDHWAGRRFAPWAWMMGDATALYVYSAVASPISHSAELPIHLPTTNCKPKPTWQRRVADEPR